MIIVAKYGKKHSVKIENIYKVEGWCVRMISTQYIHGINLVDTFQYECCHFLNDLDDYENRIIALEFELEEKKFFNENVDEFMSYMESEEKNIFEKIGNKIMELGKAFIETVDKILKTVKEKLFGVKKLTNDEKYMKMMQDDPEFALKFKEAIAGGNLKMNDFKDINTLIEEANKIGNDYLSGKIDDKKYKEKMDKKLEEHANRAKNITTILGVATAAVTAATHISKVANGLTDCSRNAMESRELLRQSEQDARAYANQGAGSASRLNRWAAYHQRLMNLTARDVGVLGRVSDRFYSLIINRTGGNVGRPHEVNTQFTANLGGNTVASNTANTTFTY